MVCFATGWNPWQNQSIYYSSTNVWEPIHTNYCMTPYARCWCQWIYQNKRNNVLSKDLFTLEQTLRRACPSFCLNRQSTGLASYIVQWTMCRAVRQQVRRLCLTKTVAFIFSLFSTEYNRTVNYLFSQHRNRHYTLYGRDDSVNNSNHLLTQPVFIISVKIVTTAIITC